MVKLVWFDAEFILKWVLQPGKIFSKCGECLPDLTCWHVLEDNGECRHISIMAFPRKRMYFYECWPTNWVT